MDYAARHLPGVAAGKGIWPRVEGGQTSLHAHLLAASLATTIFCLDAFTSSDLAVATLYGLVLLIGGGGATSAAAPRRVIISWAILCVILALLGYAIFRARGAPPLALVHLAFSLIVVCVTTLVLLRAQMMGAAAEHVEKRYRVIFDSLAIAIWEHDFSAVEVTIRRLREGGVSDLRHYLADHPEVVQAMRHMVRITDVNATALTMMGVRCKADFFARLSDFLPETDDSFAECILAVDERRELFQSEAIVLPAIGLPKQVIIAFGLGPDASLDRVPGSILDVSHRRELEAQIRRTCEELAEAQRRGALAAMSAAIAHELNQPMSAIQSFADAARRWLNHAPPDLDETGRALAGLTAGIDHARQVMQRVRAMVRDSRLDLVEVELGGMLATTAALMRREAAEMDTRLVILPIDDDVAVPGDRILLKQVFVNLITNAIQAMLSEAPDRRVVSLTLERRGDHAVVTVADRGPGWGEPGVGRVFDSFYTTKEEGMGLGLSISRTVVERHGGSMILGDVPNGGAKVEVLLPLWPDAGSAACGSALSDRGLGQGIMGERLANSGEEYLIVERLFDQVDDQA